MGDAAKVDVDSVDRPEPPTPETPAPATQAAEEARPEWLPEKFKSPEDLAVAYSELSKKLGGAPAPEADAEAKAEEGPASIPEPAEEANPLAKYEEEFATSDSLSDSSYEELASKGYPRAVVDGYIAGQRALAAQRESEVFGLVGGKETFTEMTAWASKNLSPEEITTINEGLAEGGTKTIMAVRALTQAYQSAEGSTPKLIDGTSGGAVPQTVYEDYSQVVKDMSHPDYQTDPMYRKQVADRLRRSSL